MPLEHLGARLTVGVDGSFGTLYYPLLAVARAADATSREADDEHPQYLLTEDLLKRGFRPACDADHGEIALRAQPADGSIQCHATIDGLISLVFDNKPVWSRPFDPEDAETALWLTAAQTREVTLISGDHLQITETEIDLTLAAVMGTLVTAKIPTVWT
ncbi:hypothetical protein [Pseudarthrobacter sulfonivorans]|uniref:hypothetical protein n=1 Tax=Pseudarthrobacter sulfonivorans TaxID=121292 RepID=UPI00277EF2F5|nr:hypothetical protein [Pseudarthrobacter sulfonivorans]MDP9998386.1 hypothetical protein [Pseudarthrobacter sulfonivorans]